MFAVFEVLISRPNAALLLAVLVVFDQYGPYPPWFAVRL